MSQLTLFEAVDRLAQLTHEFTDADLGQPWTWRAHEEGVRFALLGTYHELRDLAVILSQIRAKIGPAVTAAQRATAQYHAAYRELQAVLVGVDDDAYDQVPAPGEWQLRYILAHIVGAERAFFTLVHYGVRRQREEQELPVQMPEDETERVAGPRADIIEIMENQGLPEMAAYYETLHQRALDEFVRISDAELNGPSKWWEGEEYSLQYRLHRFDAHLRQHTIQAEKTLMAIDRSPNEAIRLLRLIYQALAEVESATLGAAELGGVQRRALAGQIVERAEAVVAAVAQARQMAAAVSSGDLGHVRSLLEKDAKLVNAIDQNQLSMVLTAAYRGHQDVVAALLEAGAQLTIFDAAAVGRLDVVKQEVENWAESINEFGIDGFSPLQLACFFGHEEISLWLIDQGADVNAVAQNAFHIQPIHAAATTGNLKVLTSLLQHGADANAKQQNDFTPLHTAADKGDVAMTRLLLEYGASPDSVTEDGRTPLALAQEKGHERVAVLLQ